MYSSFAVFALAALAAAEPVALPVPVPGGVSSAISPSSTAPAGCSPNYDGTFEIAPVNVTSSSGKRDLLQARQDHNILTISLKNGILTDSLGRTGYIASNYQFQFDDPPQAGAIYTAGFSICDNTFHLAIGSDQVWQKCLSGPGSTNNQFFYNLYLKNSGGQCIPSYILAEPVASGDGPAPVTGGATSATASAVPSSTSATSTSTSTVTAAHNTTMTSTTKASNGTMSTTSMSKTSATHKPTAGGVTTRQTTVTSPASGSMSGTATSGAATSGSPTASKTSGGGSGGSTVSTASNAAAATGVRGEIVGLAAGLLAYAVL